jgi:hypothetical protein
MPRLPGSSWFKPISSNASPEWVADDPVSVTSEGITVQFGDLAGHATLEVYCRNAKEVTENGAPCECVDYQYDAQVHSTRDAVGG